MSNYQQELATLEEVLGIAGVQVREWQYQGTQIIRLRVKSKNEIGVCPDCGKLCSKEHYVGAEQLIGCIFWWPLNQKRSLMLC